MLLILDFINCYLLFDVYYLSIYLNFFLQDCLDLYFMEVCFQDFVSPFLTRKI